MNGPTSGTLVTDTQGLLLLGHTKLLTSRKRKPISSSFDRCLAILIELVSKRVFLLGPSHHVYLDSCALSKFDAYETPFGNLRLDLDTIDRLRQTGKFKSMSSGTDEDEHSLELHLPYIYRMLELFFEKEVEFPKLVPVLVGNTSPSVEREFAAVFADYLNDPSNVFVVSSDFAHWGHRFRYTHYLPDLANPKEIVKLGQRGPKPPEGRPKIFQAIECFDRIVMDAIGRGDHNEYWRALEATDNNVCGRHPIGIVLATMEIMASRSRINSLESNFRFINYRRSNDITEVWDSSVSYASAFAVVRLGDIKGEMASKGDVFRDLNSDTLLEEMLGPRPKIAEEDDAAGGIEDDEGRPRLSEKAISDRAISQK